MATVLCKCKNKHNKTCAGTDPGFFQRGGGVDNQLIGSCIYNNNMLLRKEGIFNMSRAWDKGKI